MAKKINNDWTGSVRDRLEKRELKPSDTLWERIGEALPHTAEPHRVRRLPWGAALGAAAAAALAAVLFLRPSGAPEPGRIEVVTSPAAAPVAMAEEAPEDSVIPNPVTAVIPSSATAVIPSAATAVIPSAAKESVPTGTPEDSFVGFQPPRNDNNVATAGTDNTAKANSITKKTDDVRSMSMEEFIDMEETAKRRHRSLSAAVFASGVPSASGLGKIIPDIADLSFDKMSSRTNDGSLIPADSQFPSESMANSANSGKQDGNQAGYTNNPESQDGFNPVKYTEDPYNINGTRMNHSRPISAGLALTVPLGGRLFAESGVYWSWLRSTSAMVSDQSLHSVGIPLKLGYDFGGPGRISFSVSAGGKAEKVVYAVRAGTKYKEPGIQLAAVGNAAVQFNITRNLGIFLAPELSYWFTQTALPTYNTENPLNLSLRAGLNLKLGD
ncbi:MAG: hypothetical protein J5374_11515 [Bacteroidales bacterium]|nr:hypothetical protein [Bacteroidales bacterium]